MRHFDSLGSFAGHLLTLQVKEVLALHEGLKVCAKHVEATAKDEIGFYQQAVGPFPAWAPLADSTEAEKARLGYEPDAPLLRKGDLRDSISHQVGALEAVIGSPDPVALYQEIGTPTIPPRPFLGPAVIHNGERIKRILGASAFSGLVGADPIHAALGYEGEVS
jgi:phage gpG-like protein